MRKKIDTFGVKFMIGCIIAGYFAALLFIKKHVSPAELPMDGNDLLLICAFTCGGVFSFMMFFTFPSIRKMNKQIDQHREAMNMRNIQSAKAIAFLDFLQWEAAKRLNVERQELLKEYKKYQRKEK